MTAIERARELIGGTVAMAEALGVSAPTVSEWVVGKRKVPMGRCVHIERLIQSQVTRAELRPDIDWTMFQDPSAYPREEAGADATGSAAEDRA